MMVCILVIFIILFRTSESTSLYNRSFPVGFRFGTATSAYQIEGAWNEDGKGENIWDHITHKNPGYITDKSNADIACNSYHKYLEDIELLKDLGVHYYRFSISWARIFPTGSTKKANKAGVDYYNNVINALIKNNIEPMVTLYHWDLPQHLQERGGFLNRQIVKNYTSYARFVFSKYGDRVKMWTTFNEPNQICMQGYGGKAKAPALNKSGILDYKCAHNLILAHASAYRVYQREFKEKQGGKIGIVLDGAYPIPLTNNKKNLAAQERALQFTFGIWAHPIFLGDYPKIMKTRIANRSKAEGYKKSRLPSFTKKQVKYVKGTSDYFGLNHYTSMMVVDGDYHKIGKPSFEKDQGVLSFPNPLWSRSASVWLRVVPKGFRLVLTWIKKEYENPEIVVTENGFTDHGSIKDNDRINYHRLYLNSMLEAIYEDKVNVTRYTLWSLMDNFEWQDGYSVRCGLYHVDFEDKERPRTPKLSAKFYKKVITSRCLDEKGKCVK